MVRQRADGAALQEEEGVEIMGLLGYIKDRRIYTLIIFIAILGVLDALYGGPHILHFGIEFIGGTQIPVTLVHPVNPDQMSSLINTLQQRVSTFGLKEVTIEGIGNSEVYVIIPTVSPKEINQTIAIIESQGVFQGIVNGKEAINGSGILPGSIGTVPPTTQGGNVSWAVDFYITTSAANHFSKIVYGQANKPLYMFLDRPSNSIVILNSSILDASLISGMTEQNAISALQQALALQSNPILLQILYSNQSNLNSVMGFLAAHNSTYHNVIMASKGTPSSLANAIRSMNYTLRLETVQNITPVFTSVAMAPGQQSYIVDSWPAVGLLSAPLLSPGVTNGTSGQSYQISGFAPPALPYQQKINYASQQSTTITSILSGGALPVSVIVGAPTLIPPELGKSSLYVSGIAGIIAIIAVSSVIIIRYKKLFLIVPIIITTVAELFIILSVIGLIGTIDLAAVAGMIAVVGTGVDAQIIITDEILMGKDLAAKTKLSNAFYIVWADAALLVIAMLPLLFSTSLVSIIGFSESTILGALLGVLITRPFYGAIVSRHYGGGV
ncbi:MAG: hypothetical protein QW144_02440 [Candidatus Micrarchaeaceae archaeon]